MSSSRYTLAPDEKVLYKTGLHWSVYVLECLPFRIFTLLMIIPLIDIAATGGIPGMLMCLLSMFTVSLLIAYIWRKTTAFTVTDRRLIIRHGFGLRTVVIKLDDSPDINVEQGWIGRKLGYGTLCVAGIDGKAKRFSDIANVVQLVDVIHKQTNVNDSGRSGD